MKSYNDILDFLKQTIEEVSLGNVKKENILPENSLLTDLGLDSLDYASVMLSGETYVGYKLNENEIDWREIRTVAQLAELLFKSQAE